MRIFLCNGIFWLLSSLLLATDTAPISEGSFGYFRQDTDAQHSLHDATYSVFELFLLEELKSQLEQSRSPEKDAMIARALAQEIKRKHRQLLEHDNLNACFFWAQSSMPRGLELDDIAEHSLKGRWLSLFGRNRTFRALVKLKWLNADGKPTEECPSVFRATYEEALRQSCWF